MKKFFPILVLLPLFLMSCQKEVGNSAYVNVFLGTAGEGHCSPAATFPGGMVQPGADTRNAARNNAGQHAVGYQYGDSIVIGFTATHMSGVGCPSLSDLLLMPVCGRSVDFSDVSNSHSVMDKASETAEPGYYAVKLRDNHVFAEMTSTQRVALEKFSFQSTEDAQMLVDLQFGRSWEVNAVKDCWQQLDDYSVYGYRNPTEWVSKDQYYVITFDHKISSVTELPKEVESEKAPRYVLSFDMGADKVLEARIALSTVSVDNARAAVAAEAPFGKVSFESVRKASLQAWDKELSKMSIETSNPDQKVIFYTALYHSLMQPFDIADIDGSFRSQAGEVVKSRSGHFYTTFSFWDTYRATNPLFTIISQEFASQVNSSVMEQYEVMVPDPAVPQKANKFLPRWALWGRETNTMIANHAVPILVEAILKGIPVAGYTENEVMDAIWETVTKTHYRNHSELIDKFGYIPYDYSITSVDDGRETVARLLEGCYDYYAGALLAERLGRTEQAQFLRIRAADYVNVYDSDRKFFVGKNAAGEFKKEFDPSLIVGEWLEESDFCEGNAWHYLFHVQNDVPGLITLFGGEEAFRERLDSMFYTSEHAYQRLGGTAPNASIGQYWHGNEPCEHVPFLYKYTDQGYKADAILDYITREFNSNTPDGIGGNDDAGQMSSLYLFTVAGFYPVDPCSGEYVLGAPQAPEVAFNLENGNRFVVKAENISPDNIFVESITLNGQPYTGLTLRHEDIMKGGELVFKMTSRPDREELQNFSAYYRRRNF